MLNGFRNDYSLKFTTNPSPGPIFPEEQSMWSENWGYIWTFDPYLEEASKQEKWLWPEHLRTNWKAGNVSVRQALQSPVVVPH